MHRSSTLKLMVKVWREVAGHLEIHAFLEAVVPALEGELPLHQLAVVRLEPGKGRVDPLAAVALRPGGGWVDVRDRIGGEPGLFRTVHEALEAGGLVRRAGLGPPFWWCRKLEAGDSSAGVLVGQLGEIVGHEALLAALEEPFQVALVNDRRLQELARLREAAEADNRALLTRLERQDIAETVVGERTGLREVMERVDQVAPTDAPVLILGETGSGKEVVARAVHERSRRRDGPFLRVNCGAIPAELVDSELFGHEKGSFTGAATTRRGWFERADGGTLFLDELGELPAAAQVRLLRVLQDGSFERVGGQRVLRADVRVVAATHRDLGSLISAGRFREDLWYRIAVFPVRLPALRERPEDLLDLCSHFAARAGRRLRGNPLEPTTEDIRLLRQYDWPGNVRELAAVVERAAILGDGRRLDFARALGSQATLPVARPMSPSPIVEKTPGNTLEDITRAAIEEALKRSGGRIQGPGGAAEALRVNPSTLRSRMERLGLDWRKGRRGDG
jgi:hydrogenase-4 transcriptional activator